MNTIMVKSFRKTFLIAASFWMVGCNGPGSNNKTGPAIDRHALVTRHNITWNDLNGQIPLGNGEFCFNADGTGLQTLGGNTMSHWGWHSFPLPPGITPEDVPPTGTFQQGRNKGPDVFPEGKQELRHWMFDTWRKGIYSRNDH